MARRKHHCDLRYQLRLTAADRKAWESAAKKAGLPLSDWIRGQLAVAAGGKMTPRRLITQIDTAYPDGAR